MRLWLVGRAVAIKSREAAPLLCSVPKTTASFRVKTVNRYLLRVNSPRRFICEWSEKCAQGVGGVGMKLLGRRMGRVDAGESDCLLPPHMWCMVAGGSFVAGLRLVCSHFGFLRNLATNP